MAAPGWLKAVAQGLGDYWRILVLGLVWLTLLVSLVTWGLVDQANAKTDTSKCHKQPQATGNLSPAPTHSPAPTQLAQLKPHSEPSSAIAFYQDRIVARRQIGYDITDPDGVLPNKARLDILVGPFLNTSNSHELNADDINASALVARSRVILDVCFNRTDPAFGSPGSYSGVVTITDPRVTLTDVTFTVTMAYPWRQIVFAVLVAMLLPAVLYVWFLRSSFTSQPGLKPTHFQQWIFSRVALMSLGAGLAAAIGIFSATYARSEAWGSDYTAATALFGASFSAFVAAATGVTAAGVDTKAHLVAATKESDSGRQQQAPDTSHFD
jgi:hypothetical protein